MSLQILNGRYRIETFLGRGAQGDVLLAGDLKLGRKVAVKILRTGGTSDSRTAQALRREALVMASFAHPNVVAIYDYDVCSDQGWPFLVMEYLQGDSLETLITSLSDQEMQRLVSQVGGALQHAHSNGLVHRDLKPANLMLVNRGRHDQRFVVLDLGIAKLSETANQSFDAFGSMTFSGAGTPYYMAPEQATSGVVDHRADIYAMGGIIYHLMSGRSPFQTEGESLSKILNAVATKLPAPLIEVAIRRCSIELSSLITQCLAKEPHLRPSSIMELVTRFDRCLGEIRESVGNAVSGNVVKGTAIPDSTYVPYNQVERFSNSGIGSQPRVGDEQVSHSVSGFTSGDTLKRNQTVRSNLAQARSGTRNPRGMGQRFWVVASAGVILVGSVAALYIASNQLSTDDSTMAGPARDPAHAELLSVDPGVVEAEEIAANPDEFQYESDPAEYLIQAPEIDEATNQVSAESKDVKVDLGTQQLAEDIEWNWQPEYHEESLSSFELNADAPEGLAIDTNTGLISWTPGEIHGPGRYQVTVSAVTTDHTRFEGGLELLVEEVNHPPVLEPVEGISTDELEQVSFLVSAEDPDSPRSSLRFELSEGHPQGASIDPDTGQFKWTPGEADGPGVFELGIKVSDEQSTGELHVPIEVTEVNRPPAIRPIDPIRIDECRPIEFSITATDPDLPEDSFELKYELISPLPEGASFDDRTGHFAWTPSEEQGPTEYTASFRVSDGLASSEIEVPIVVNETSQPPEFDSLPTQQLRPGESLSFRIVVRDPDVPSSRLHFTIEKGPRGMTIDRRTGHVRWSPNYGDLGQDHEVTIVATKDNGLSNEASLLVEVAPRTHTNSIGMELVFIPSGEFVMGSPQNEQDRHEDETQRRIQISKPYLMGVEEVSVAQFHRVMNAIEPVGQSGHGNANRDADNDPIHSIQNRVSQSLEGQFEDFESVNSDEGLDEIVRMLAISKSTNSNDLSETELDWVAFVSWEEAVAFCEMLNELERDSGYRYRLPTEAEWEYACRAGSTTPYSFDIDEIDLDYEFASSIPDVVLSRGVLRFNNHPANDWGLQYMHGSVPEWCQDWYGEYETQQGAIVDPMGPRTGKERVVRGGRLGSDLIRSAERLRSTPNSVQQEPLIGFRVVCELR